MIIGTSIILKHGNGLLFEVQKPSKWIREADGSVSIGIGCIGGTLEKGERSHETLQREAVEEIGCEVEWVQAADPFLTGPQGSIRELDETAPEGAQFLWEVDRPGYVKGARVAVYVGRPIGSPSPGDLPALLTTDLETLSLCRSRQLTFDDLIQRGSLLQEREPIPRSARPFPIGTPEILLGIRDAHPEVLQRLLSATL